MSVDYIEKIKNVIYITGINAFLLVIPAKPVPAKAGSGYPPSGSVQDDKFTSTGVW